MPDLAQVFSSSAIDVNLICINAKPNRHKSRFELGNIDSNLCSHFWGRPYEKIVPQKNPYNFKFLRFG